MPDALLEIKNLSVSFAVGGVLLPAVREFNLTLSPNEVVGLVGESGSGKSTALLAVMNYLPENAVVAFALGADLVNVGREAMLSIGCVQAQKCHTDTCPTGVATQNPWLAHGLDPALKSVRCANYIRTLRRDLLKLAEATGVEHPGRRAEEARVLRSGT